MASTSFPSVWARITAHAGQRFATKTGRAFTYVIERDALVTDYNDHPLAKANFAEALKQVPFDGPGRIAQTVRGPAYVWAILHDSRIRATDW
jgi:hypothetical protein